MTNLKYRILTIVGMVLVSVWALFPRTVVERVKRNGVFVTDTVRRVPLKRGLDLQGGMHLTLEVDETKGAVANKSEALDRALRVVRNRIDELGVSEPVVQKVGDDRIIVELPGVDGPIRAQAVVQKAAFLEFQIADETQALERSLARLDAVAAQKLPTVAAVTPADTATAAGGQKGLTSLFGADSARRDTTAAGTAAGRDSAGRTDSAGRRASTTGAFSRAVQQGNHPGQYIVAEDDYRRLQPLVELPEIQGALPPGKSLRWGADSIV